MLPMNASIMLTLPKLNIIKYRQGNAVHGNNVKFPQRLVIALWYETDYDDLKFWKMDVVIILHRFTVDDFVFNISTKKVFVKF